MSIWWFGYKKLHRTSSSANLGKIQPTQFYPLTRKKKKNMISPSSIDLHRKHHSHNKTKKKMLKAGKKAAEFRDLRMEGNTAVSTLGFLSTSAYIPPWTLSYPLRTTNRCGFCKKDSRKTCLYHSAFYIHLLTQKQHMYNHV